MVDPAITDDLQESPHGTKVAIDLQRFKYTEPEGVRRSLRSQNQGAKNHEDKLKIAKDSPDRVKKPLAKQRTGTASPSASKARRPSSKYAAPSRYAHLSPLVDILEPGLDLVFVGVNPGISTAIEGHGYAHPSNRFWHLLHVCGLTPERRLSPTEDRNLPRLYNMGMTNIVSRPTKDQGELSKAEMVEGAGVLEEKFRKWKPEVVCLVGKGIWEAIWKYKHGRSMKKEEFAYGWQDEGENMGRSSPEDADEQGQVWMGSKVFVATSTSGQAASMRPAEKEAVWRPLGEWLQKRRAERTQNPNAVV